MSAFKNKYLTLKEASLISGYTVRELQNFCKIGLVPSRRYKSKTLLRFDAFEKLSPGRQKTKRVVKKSKKHMSVSPTQTQSLVPFTAPSRHLVSLMQPVALAATLVMVLHIISLPTNPERTLGVVLLPVDTMNFMADASEELITTSVDSAAVVLAFAQDTLDSTADNTAELIASAYDVGSAAVGFSKMTLAYMGEQTTGLIAESYELASAAAISIGSTPVYAGRPLEDVHAAKVAHSTSLVATSNEVEMVAHSTSLVATSNEVEMVAGIATAAEEAPSVFAENSPTESFLISIADGFDSFDRAVTVFEYKAFNGLIHALRFESLDAGIQETFRW